MEVTERWSNEPTEGETTAHPYLARQMSDVGFWQTLKVRTLGCARSLSLLPIYALARYDLADELDELATQEDTRFILVWATIVV